MIRALLVALFVSLGAIAAAAQGCGSQNPNCIVPTAPPGTSNNQAASTAFVAQATSVGPVIPANSVLGNATGAPAPAVGLTTLPPGLTIPSANFSAISQFLGTISTPSTAVFLPVYNDTNPTPGGMAPIMPWWCQGVGPSCYYQTTGGHIVGHSQSAMLVEGFNSQFGPTQQEAAAWFDVNSITGAVNAWVASSPYTAGQLMFSGNNSDIYTVTANCVSGTTAPSGPSPPTNGTCNLVLFGAGLNNGKEGILTSCNLGVVGGGVAGGNLWCQAEAATVRPGGFPTYGGSVYAFESDTLNLDKDCPPGVAGACQFNNFFINGIPSATNLISAGIQFGGAGAGTWMAHDGIGIGVNYAKDVAIEDGSGATTGIRTATRLEGQSIAGNNLPNGAPFASGCGTASLSALSTDFSGRVTITSVGTTTCQVNFAKQRAAETHCIVQSDTGGISVTPSPSTVAAVAWLMTASVNPTIITYICPGI